MEDFHEFWKQCVSDPRLTEFLSPGHLLFIEQPLHRDEALACIQDAALAPPRQGFVVTNAGRGSMVARRGLDFSAATSIAAGFGEVLHSCRAMQQQSLAVELG